MTGMPTMRATISTEKTSRVEEFESSLRRILDVEVAVVVVVAAAAAVSVIAIEVAVGATHPVLVPSIASLSKMSAPRLPGR